LIKPEYTKRSPALVILNVCGDSILREERANAQHDAGYYTSAARSREEAIQLATQMNFAIAVLCHSLTACEQRSVREWMRERAPETTVILLWKPSDDNPELLLSAVRTAALSRGTSDAADLQAN
jgi:DNA-binding response OmpR family regulator